MHITFSFSSLLESFILKKLDCIDPTFLVWGFLEGGEAGETGDIIFQGEVERNS